MPPCNILIAVVDGLRASALGAYGNTTFATPALDRFAAESFALDWCYAPGAELAEAYRALWNSQHPMRPQSVAAGGSSLPAMLSALGYRTVLVTDEPEVAALAGAAEFDRVIDAAGKPHGTPPRAEQLSETRMARLFAAASEVVAAESDDSPRLVWVHSRGMYGPWDAPLELQESLLDEEDPPPIRTVAPPDIVASGSDEPDAVFRYSSAYAGQVMALDACWQGLIDAVEHGQSPGWLIMFIGVRGYPIGEHRRIGGVERKLYGEQLHVPALLRFPSGLGRLARSGALTSHLDILPTLVHWIENRPAEKLDGMSLVPLATAARTAWRDALVFAGDAGSRAIRTVEWCLRQDAAAAETVGESTSPETKGELFVRPDDRWEANDVAKLCPDVVDTLTVAIDEASRQIAHGEPIPTRMLQSDTSDCRA